MSNIANTLDALLRDSKKSAAELSRASGINEAQICRIINGLQVWVSSETTVKLATGLAANLPNASVPRVHAQLLRAHLQDECKGPGAKFISIDLLGAPIAPVEPLHDQPQAKTLPPKTQRDLDVIAEHIMQYPHIREMVGSLANLCRSHQLPQARPV